MALKALTLVTLMLAVLFMNKLALVIAVALEVVDGVISSWHKSTPSRP